MSAPQLVLIAGPNGAGKSTFHRTFLSRLGLYFVNADEIAQKLGISSKESARAADAIRAELLSLRFSFITETVFSDPVGAKLAFLRDAIAAGYEVKLNYIGLSSVMLSEARVSMRVDDGGHDVPPDRLPRRFAQSLRNLAAAMEFVPEVSVYDNSSADNPFHLVLIARSGRIVLRDGELRQWLSTVLGERWR